MPGAGAVAEARFVNDPRVLDRVDRQLRRLAGGARVRVARDQIARLRAINRRVNELTAELLELVTAHRPQLLAETGCGPVTAAILIGHTAGAKRFRSDGSLAMMAGAAPIPCSSGQRQQHRLNRGGDRQLNHALHIIATTRASHDPATKQYLARKEGEGKTTKAALRCLKRHLARRIQRLLAEPPDELPQTIHQQAIAEPQLPTLPPSPPPRREINRQIAGAAPYPIACTT